MKFWLFGKGREFVRAPISGSAILFASVACVYECFWTKDLKQATLWMILMTVWSIRRDKYLEENDV